MQSWQLFAVTIPAQASSGMDHNSSPVPRTRTFAQPVASQSLGEEVKLLKAKPMHNQRTLEQVPSKTRIKFRSGSPNRNTIPPILAICACGFPSTVPSIHKRTHPCTRERTHAHAHAPHTHKHTPMLATKINMWTAQTRTLVKIVLEVGPV